MRGLVATKTPGGFCSARESNLGTLVVVVVVVGIVGRPSPQLSYR